MAPTAQPLPQEADLARLNGVSVTFERINSWRQDSEPKPGTPVYQNTPESDVLPPETGMVLDHSWSEVPVSNGDRCGLYHGQVLTVRFDEKIQRRD